MKVILMINAIIFSSSPNDDLNSFNEHSDAVSVQEDNSTTNSTEQGQLVVFDPHANSTHARIENMIHNPLL